MRLPTGSLVPGSPVMPAYPIPYVETLAYQVLPDPNTDGQFILRVARFSIPSIQNATAEPSLNLPQTIACD